MKKIIFFVCVLAILALMRLCAQVDPAPSPTPYYVFKPVPPPVRPTPAATAKSESLPEITVIPNPAWGKKLSFRVLSQGKASVKIRVYNRFLDVIANLSQKGDKFFDLLWSLQKVPEGIYYYQAEITDSETGQTVKIPIQKFVVMKSESSVQSPHE